MPGLTLCLGIGSHYVSDDKVVVTLEPRIALGTRSAVAKYFGIKRCSGVGHCWSLMPILVSVLFTTHVTPEEDNDGNLIKLANE